MKAWIAAATFSLGITGAALAQSSDPAALYQSGQIGAAQAALAAHPPATDAERLIACRLALYSNRLPEARRCITDLRAAAPQDRTLLLLWAEAAWRSGDYAAAAQARETVGATAAAARLRWFARRRPYAFTPIFSARHIHFERVDPLPVVKARLGNGQERFFIVDTGASDTVIDPTLAGEARVRTFGAATGHFATGQTAQTTSAVADSMSLGGVTLRNVPVVILDTSSYNDAAPGLRISGVIGTGLLSRFVSTIDYPRSELVLRNRRVDASGDLVMPMWLFGDHFIITDGAVNDHAYAALIDTGLAGLACTMPRSTFDAIGAQAGPAANAGASGAGQQVQAAPFRAVIALGALRRSDQNCVLGPFPSSIETLGGARIGVLVSHAFLRPYAVTFDFTHMRLVLSPPPG